MSWQVELRRVRKVFDERVVLRDLSASITAPGAWTILGPNGSGKSTLLRILAGLLAPTEGEVVYLYNGTRLTPHQRRQAVGLVAPDVALYRPLTALENLRFFARARGVWASDSELLNWLERVGLRARAHDPVSSFSTGMVQRLKVLTALVHRPPVLLLDEPGSNLDEAGMEFIRETVREHAKDGIVIIATNDTRELGYGEPLVQLAREAFAVFAKDWLLELRTRVALGAVVLFAVTSVVAAGIALAPPSGVPAEVKAALLWVVLFFAAVAGLSRTFVVEEETRTADALRLAVSPAGVFVGKLWFNVVLMWVLCLIVVPLYLVLLEAPGRYLSLLTTVVLLGSGALACATTAVGAIVARSTMRGALFGVLAFPVALPPMLVSIHGTRAAWVSENAWRVAAGDLQVLVGFILVMVSASLLVFEHIWVD